ncbi:FAD:protein FMN transferase [uncultured Christiangramia sp.]|uniref:FAD:protein FMN transferase n=1 Tax=uncultured Christiangramia sp. TaxID=503836 RepID=UPI00260C8114|nr:FAD:protein FMN transferase [uncultured Christiangramia sp.]
MNRISIFIITVLTLVSCDSRGGLDIATFQGEALGTTYSVQYFSEGELDFTKSMDSIVDIVNGSMSTYQQDSDISLVNRGDSIVTVDEHFIKVFEASKKIYAESNGFFDPTVGVLVNAYGFGPGKVVTDLYAERLDSLNQLVGLNKVRINEDQTVSKENPNVYIDFNAIAKGYTIDLIGQYLEDNGVSDYLIELGGELKARGKNRSSGKEWLVGIDNPLQDGPERQFNAKVMLKNASMATSGNYRKYRVDSITGERFVHTVNPITGFAEKSNLLSASVIAENCMMADGYATALMAMGLDRSASMLKELKSVEVYLIYSDENGSIKTYVTPGFISNLVD